MFCYVTNQPFLAGFTVALLAALWNGNPGLFVTYMQWICFGCSGVEWISALMSKNLQYPRSASVRNAGSLID